jgi:hypothetical protein
MAKSVAKTDLQKSFKHQGALIKSLAAKRSLSQQDVAKLADALARWTKHRAVYRRLEKQPRKKTLAGLKVLVDESRDIYDRLAEIKREKLLRGLQIPALSILLYWSRPESYVPYNAKTRVFLEDAKMAHEGMSASSPACYQTWLAFAEDLRAKLRLPLMGHIDRLVTKYYDTKHA